MLTDALIYALNDASLDAAFQSPVLIHAFDLCTRRISMLPSSTCTVASTDLT